MGFARQQRRRGNGYVRRSTTFTIVTADHVYVYVQGRLVLKTYRDRRQPTWLFQVAPSQAIQLPK